MLHIFHVQPLSRACLPKTIQLLGRGQLGSPGSTTDKNMYKDVNSAQLDMSLGNFTGAICKND
eukprot:scaffold82077_cov9-Tisochrysis_lutea.AAC.1